MNGASGAADERSVTPREPAVTLGRARSRAPPGSLAAGAWLAAGAGLVGRGFATGAGPGAGPRAGRAASAGGGAVSCSPLRPRAAASCRPRRLQRAAARPAAFSLFRP